MRIGYSAWGFIGDGLLDSPDGGRLTRSLFLEHLIKNNYDIVWLQQNRDVENGKLIFSEANIDNQKTNQRKTLCQIKYDEQFPEIDILFLEWRWKLPGRNCNVDKNSKAYTPDLDRQIDLLKYYLPNENVKIVIWDKDETMSFDDELNLAKIRTSNKNIIILSPALYPESLYFPRSTLLFPCDLDSIRGTKVNDDIKYLIGYVGSQYDRDDQVYKYINPFSFAYPDKVLFVGNWNKYPEKAARNSINFPKINFADRILPKDMDKVYSSCLTTVLLCKKNYAEHGHITQRIHEAAANGVIAIGLKEQKSIDEFILPINLISDAFDLIHCIERLYDMSVTQRQTILDEQIELLKPFDIHNVIVTFEKLIRT